MQCHLRPYFVAKFRLDEIQTCWITDSIPERFVLTSDEMLCPSRNFTPRKIEDGYLYIPRFRQGERDNRRQIEWIGINLDTFTTQRSFNIIIRFRC